MSARHLSQDSTTLPRSFFFAAVRTSCSIVISHMALRPALKSSDLRAPTLRVAAGSTLPASSSMFIFGRMSLSRLVVFSSSPILVYSTSSRVVAALPLRTLCPSRSLPPLAVRAIRRSCPFVPRSSTFAPRALVLSCPRAPSPHI